MFYRKNLYTWEQGLRILAGGALAAYAALAIPVGMLSVADALSSWLFTVVRHACMRLARSVFHKTLAIEDFENELYLAAVPTADLRMDVAAAISSLPPHYRQIIILRDLAELTIDEIAISLALSRESVKGRLHRARTLLREYLSK